jgi:potassium channel
MIITPFRVAFYDQDTTLWIVLDSLVDFLFVVDIILNFFMAYFDEADHLISDKRTIAKRYLRSWFLIDAFAVIPFNLMVTSSRDYSSLARLARLPKLYRLLRMTKLI